MRCRERKNIWIWQKKNLKTHCEGTLKLLEENNKLKTEVNQLNYENQQLRESLVQQANGVSNTTEDSTGRSAVVDKYV